MTVAAVLRPASSMRTLYPMGPIGWDDWLDGFYLQCSSQWDGLRHIREH